MQIIFLAFFFFFISFFIIAESNDSSEHLFMTKGMKRKKQSWIAVCIDIRYKTDLSCGTFGTALDDIVIRFVNIET